MADARAVDDARREWTQPWSGEEEADRRRAQLTFSWNTCRAPYKMIWRAAFDNAARAACEADAVREVDDQGTDVRERSGVAAPMDGEAAVPQSGGDAQASSSDSETVRTPSEPPHTPTFPFGMPHLSPSSAVTVCAQPHSATLPPLTGRSRRV